MNDKQYEDAVLGLLGKSIDFMLEERQMTLQRLSELSGVSRNSINKVRRGDNYNIGILIRLWRVLQVHIEISAMDANNNIHSMIGGGPSPN
jgi:transcriptional regulator with XRE-family HTH domain